ncbi:MAG: Rrf2 family transcriptional regulator [Rhodospirillales bacterium]|nr:Rrf2 family transcriptional regulator [Rhodospirillales bacterium]
MILTSYTDYGLRALMVLASDPQKVQSTISLAGKLNISRHHLAKILQDLVIGGYLVSVRGAAGGVKLAYPPAQIQLGEVAHYLARDQALVECFHRDGGNCSLRPSCRLRGALSKARESFFISLNEYSVADISAVIGANITS